MNSIDSASNGLYYNAAQAAGSVAASQAQARNARKAKESDSVKKPLFSSMVEKRQEESRLAGLGLPPEIAGMSQEDALVFLKDRLDSAGDALSESASGQAFENYKKAVGQFVTFMQKSNFVVEEHKRFGRTRSGKKKDPAILVQTIDKKLERLNYDIWYSHLDKLKLLEKIHEINGLVVDLTAV